MRLEIWNSPSPNKISSSPPIRQVYRIHLWIPALETHQFYAKNKSQLTKDDESRARALSKIIRDSKTSPLSGVHGQHLPFSLQIAVLPL